MTPPTLNCARFVRDGGIDAMVALNDALCKALIGLPSQDQESLRLAFGRVMGDVTTEIINPAVRAFPELDPDEATWAAVAKARATERSNAA